MKKMRTIMLEPLTQASFEPYGELLLRPSNGRIYFEESLSNNRADAWPSLSLAVREEVSELPFVATQMERHAFSSQSFIPMEAGRWIVAVAPHAKEGGPNTEALRAFLAEPDQGVTYAADVWHHPLTVIDRPSTFAIMMWRDGTAGDEEFVTLAEPLCFASPKFEANT